MRKKAVSVVFSSSAWRSRVCVVIVAAFGSAQVW
jgi:hypothetical protein